MRRRSRMLLAGLCAVAGSGCEAVAWRELVPPEPEVSAVEPVQPSVRVTARETVPSRPG